VTMSMIASNQFSSDRGKSIKKSLRTQILQQRMELSKDYCQSADEAILHQLLKIPEYIQAKKVFTYVSMQGEVDTINLIIRALKDNKVIAVPKCIEKGIMEAYRIQGLMELKTGAYGILEPYENCEKIDSKALDLAMIPCVSCNERGGRLGYGGGYYDRYLPTSPAIRILLCRERVMVDDIPEEAHDCKADMVITEKRILRTNGYNF